MNKIKLLFLTGTYSIGGKERQLTEIIKNLDIQKFEIHLFTKINQEYFIDEIINNLSTTYSLDRKKYYFTDIMIMISYINKVKPDIIVSFDLLLSFLVNTFKFLFKKKSTLIDSSIRDANNNFDLISNCFNFFLKFSKYRIANSNAGLISRNELGKKGRFVLYNGFDFNKVPIDSKIELRKKLNLPLNKHIIVMASLLRLCFSKQPRRIVDLVKYIKEKNNQNLLFIILGDGVQYNSIKEEILVNGLQETLIMLGNKPNVMEYFKAADLSILFSKTEGISNSIIESMSCGTPVVTTSLGGTPEIIDNGLNGYILDDEIDIIYEHIMKLLTDSLLYDTFSRNAIQKIKSIFDLSIMLNKFEEIINQVNSDV